MKQNGVVASQDPRSYSLYFDLKIWFRARIDTWDIREKLPGHSRNGPQGSLCFTLTFCTVLICQICEFAESAPFFGK